MCVLNAKERRILSRIQTKRFSVLYCHFRSFWYHFKVKQTKINTNQLTTKKMMKRRKKNWAAVFLSHVTRHSICSTTTTTRRLSYRGGISSHLHSILIRLSLYCNQLNFTFFSCAVRSSYHGICFVYLSYYRIHWFLYRNEKKMKQKKNQLFPFD